ncbi:MAG: sulfotransferase [Phormidesmis sp.]
MKKKVVFIMGTAHCGSTLLTLVLGSHSNCRALGEVSNLPEFHRNHQSPCSVCKGECSFWQSAFSKQDMQALSQGFAERRIHRHIPLKLEKTVRGLLKNDRLFNPYSIIASRTDEAVLIDSTKTVYWLEKKLAAREFQAGLLDAQLIHLIRDGRAVMNSYARRKCYQGLSAEQFGQQFGELWMNRINNEHRFFDGFAGKKVRLRYEEFATNTENTLKDLCARLDLDFQLDMMNYWKHEHHTISGNSGTHSLINKHQDSALKQAVAVQVKPKAEKEFSIRLDQRWKTKLSAEQVAAFYNSTGNMNEAFEWN